MVGSISGGYFDDVEERTVKIEEPNVREGLESNSDATCSLHANAVFCNNTSKEKDEPRSQIQRGPNSEKKCNIKPCRSARKCKFVQVSRRRVHE